MADNTGEIKAEVFSVCNKMRKHKAYVIKNYIVKSRDHIVITKTTRLIPAGSSNTILPDLVQYADRAAMIIKYQEAVVADNLTEAKKSPVKTQVTLQGEVEQVDFVSIIL